MHFLSLKRVILYLMPSRFSEKRAWRIRSDFSATEEALK